MDWLLFQVLNHYIPQGYMAPLLVILSAFLAFEQWLASTKRIKANSTLQLIVGFVQYFVGKEKGYELETNKFDPKTQRLLPDGSIVPRSGEPAPPAGGQVSGPRVAKGGIADKSPEESSGTGCGNPYIPEYIRGPGPGSDPTGGAQKS